MTLHPSDQMYSGASDRDYLHQRRSSLMVAQPQMVSPTEEAAFVPGRTQKDFHSYPIVLAALADGTSAQQGSVSQDMAAMQSLAVAEASAVVATVVAGVVVEAVDEERIPLMRELTDASKFAK